ncbi:hypothetical protein DL96DRAFT_523046 [Flagelloscypha sp. PMI_526]|nr:hypothetical protein DL96DRAFT_523046 [Flagelloscypha sp. PMI_526]
MDLDKSCLWSLNYVRSELGHSKRETIAFLCFQIWVFMISLIGIATDSMPHLLASLATHGLVLAWGIFQVIQSIGFQSTFKRVITDGACAGAQILPDLGSIRQRTDIPLLVVNFVAFLFSAFLTLRLIKLVNWHNFKNVGANLEMNRHRKFMLILFTVIQLSFFFVAVFCALLFDLVSNGNMKTMSSFPVFYKISCIVSLIVIVPWMLSGLYGVEREKKIPTMIFLTYAVFWVCGFATMFFSTSFRQEITRWSFFAVMGAMSVLITGAALILGIACRINFGKGYLIAKDIQADSPVDHRAKSWGDLESSPYSEKLAEMPSFASDVPQFPTTFEPPRMPPTAMNIPNRFFTPSSNSSSSSVSSGKPKSKGVALTDKGATKPSYRDSSASFGNMGGLGNSPPGYQAEFSTGNSFSTTGPSFSAPPRAAPAPPATAGLGTATSVGGQLGRMFTAGSTGTSMYTPGAEPSSSWSVFGHNVGNVPVSTIPSRSGTTTAATANPPTSSTLTPQRAWSSKE